MPKKILTIFCKKHKLRFTRYWLDLLVFDCDHCYRSYYVDRRQIESLLTGRSKW